MYGRLRAARWIVCGLWGDGRVGLKRAAGIVEDMASGVKGLLGVGSG